ncbi:hypothetical protein NP511_18040 [Natrinema thermotolerans]|uniref:Uncharacterized protein n=1 Tax=Natrinema thermotolerans TaxID=121872 RepID=A0AAF0T1J9_9EURY|nr:hypothetical protein [Natrinema thermotolerans]QCC60257.1 hypothetical protein DVR14_17105 [Natrinema thermotolerans]QCC61168.1 hypothetical protein DVR14_21235 [Natrinema thermotolerans]WMT07277.1 hypothetical protein NP511_18040 [Natrinema thermotolerans]
MSDQPALEYETAVRNAKKYLDNPKTELFVFGAAQTTGTAKTMIARDLNGEIDEDVYLTVTAAIVARLADATDTSLEEIGENILTRANRMELRQDVP